MATTSTGGALHSEETAVPTLKVMRLQSPELDQVGRIDWYMSCTGSLLFLNLTDSCAMKLELTLVRLSRSQLRDRWKVNAFSDRHLRCPILSEVSW